MRLLDVIYLFPKRTSRLKKHVAGFRYQIFPFWLLELIFQLIEIVGVSDFYDTSSNIVKFNTRRLTEREIILAKTIFGASLPYGRVRVDERAHIGPRQGQFCYVSFYTINSWGRMSDPLLIHELMHVWQYHQVGIVYIPRALSAQHSPEGYDYGGADALYKAISEEKHLLDFNYEQQAEIIEDYFRLLVGLKTTWGKATSADLPVYAHFAKQLNNLA